MVAERTARRVMRVESEDGDMSGINFFPFLDWGFRGFWF